jgi:hypothetical protein
MDLPTMADHAGQVIVGTVDGVRSYWAGEPRRIESEITLKDVRYLKGAWDGAGETFTLVVPGGTMGDITARLADAPVLKAGETWVLFVLPTCKTHPVVGLHQGAFRVVRGADGVERVQTAGGRAIVDMDAAGRVETVRPARRDVRAQLVAEHGVRVRPPTATEARAGMELDAFVARLRPTLAGSRDHGLAGPAGKRVAGARRAVPLRVAENEAASGGGTARGEAARGAVEKLEGGGREERASAEQRKGDDGGDKGVAK